MEIKISIFVKQEFKDRWIDRGFSRIEIILRIKINIKTINRVTYKQTFYSFVVIIC